MAATEFNVRRLSKDECPLLRTLRLAALRDTPDQFGETFAQAAARTDEGWLELTASVTPPSAQAAFVAEINDRPVGLVFALEDRGDVSTGRLGGLWVAPDVRRIGIGIALSRAVQSWAVASGKPRIRLWVVPGSAGDRLYRRAGFIPTGTQKGFPGDESRVVLEMQLELGRMDQAS